MKNQESIWKITVSMQKGESQYSFWKDPRFSESIDDIRRLKISIGVLKKHTPEKYHALIRLIRKHSLWIMVVDNGITANRLKMMCSEIETRIAKEIGYTPKLVVKVEPTNWKTTGVCLNEPVKSKAIKTPSEKEAKKRIQKFIRSS